MTTLARVPCPWPDCTATKPETWRYCTDRGCQSKRLTARLAAFGYIDEPIADEARLAIEAEEEKRKENLRRWNRAPASMEAKRRWKRNNADREREYARRRYERLAGARAWLKKQRRETADRVANANAMYRADLWRAAKASVGEELRLLIAEQEADRDIARRMTGDPWLLDSLDRPLPGTDDLTLADVMWDSRGPWSDPTGETALFLIDLEERLSTSEALDGAA